MHRHRHFPRPLPALLLSLGLLVLGLFSTATAFAEDEDGETRITTVQRGDREIQTRVLEQELAPDGRAIRAGSLIVRFREDSDDVEREESHIRTGALRAEALGDEDTVRVQLPRGRTLEALEEYRNQPAVLSVEPDYIVSALVDPNDPRFGEQWGMSKIEASAAWDAPSVGGAAGARIAILDCGIYSDTASSYPAPDGKPGHPDLRGGKVIANKNFTTANDADDYCNHGTHVAGIAGATTNNAIGVAGTAAKASLVNVKVLGDDGNGSFSWIISGILWTAGCDTATTCGPRRADVINLSLGAAGPCSTDLQAAINRAWNQGLVIVAAAGNSGVVGSITPANCDNVVSVSASDSADQKASFSNWGSDVDVAAPGAAILSSNYLGDYSSFNGTSMASPHVAGLAALLWNTSYNVSPRAVVDRITCSASRSALAGSTYGRINARAAVTAGGCGEPVAPTLPTIAAADVSVIEGNTATSSAIFTVTLSAASAQTVTMAYATADGTATAGSDYTSVSGTLTFNPNETSKQVIVVVSGDVTVEADETFFVNLSSPTNAQVLDAQAKGTITNDDVLPSLAVDDVTVSEVTPAAAFTVRLSAASAEPVTVSYATRDGSALAGSDYTATGGTLTIAPGATLGTISVPVIDDAAFEPNETFFLDLSNAVGATIGDGQGLGTIVSDEVLPTISVNDVALVEGNSGTIAAAFTITLSAPSAQSVTVAYATANGSAASGSDYTAASGTLTFNPNETSKQIFVSVIGDTVVEPDETYFVNLSNPVNATLADAQGQGTITNDDVPPPAPSLSITDVTKAEGRRGKTTTFSFVVRLSAASSSTVRVSYATANGTAIGAGSCSTNVDFRTKSGSLSFSAGQTSKTVSIVVCGDNLKEPNETFLVNLSSPSGATVSDAQGIGTISNDD